MTLQELAEKYPTMFALFQHQDVETLNWMAYNYSGDTSKFLTELAKAKQEAIDLNQEGFKIISTMGVN